MKRTKKKRKETKARMSCRQVLPPYSWSSSRCPHHPLIIQASFLNLCHFQPSAFPWYCAAVLVFGWKIMRSKLPVVFDVYFLVVWVFKQTNFIQLSFIRSCCRESTFLYLNSQDAIFQKVVRFRCLDEETRPGPLLSFLWKKNSFSCLRQSDYTIPGTEWH